MHYLQREYGFWSLALLEKVIEMTSVVYFCPQGGFHGERTAVPIASIATAGVGTVAFRQSSTVRSVSATAPQSLV